jgi:pilus assembly protein Flp/PilA
MSGSRRYDFDCTVGSPEVGPVDANWNEDHYDLKIGNNERGTGMRRLKDCILRLRIWSDCLGQDLIEYALMAGFVAITAGAIMPSVSSSISKIFSKVASVMGSAAS